MIIGTAGHIDHGKTSVVYALTGVDTDRLKEEKARGISIELGYAYTALANGEMLGFVDVPGHEKLVHTMAAGAGGVDFALIVVAADDGVMPQTREHVAILQLLGVNRGAVAVTKIDRVDTARVRDTCAEVAALLERSALQQAAIFPVNATRREDPGISALRAHLGAVAMSWAARSAEGLFRLAVDRVFTLPGHGTVAAGTVHAGAVRVGATVTVLPSGVTARVRSIHAQSRAADLGIAGQRCALNLVGIEKAQLKRGDWLADPRALAASTRFDVSVRWLDPASAPRRSAVHVHVGTAHALARVVPLQAAASGAAAQLRAQLVFDRPVCAACGDRFILRDAEARHTIGGGRVIDPEAPARRRHGPARAAYLDAIEALLAGQGLLALLRNAPYGMAMEALVRLYGQEPEHIVFPPQTRIVVTATGSVAILEEAWWSLRAAALKALQEFHRDNPDEPGIDRGRWRRMCAPDPSMPHASDPIWRALVDELLAHRAIERSGHWLHLPQHRVELSAAESSLLEKLKAAIAAGRFDPPWVRDLSRVLQVSEDETRAVLRKCASMGGVHQVVRDLFYDRASIQVLAHVLVDLESAHGLIAAAQFRDAVGLGRKRSIQILEFFDRVGYTRRINDGRKLRTDSSWREEALS
jgi:selenocysteine-specific elongation factor